MLGSGLIWSKFSAIEGSSTCTVRPDAAIASYSGRITSTQASRKASTSP